MKELAEVCSGHGKRVDGTFEATSPSSAKYPYTLCEINHVDYIYVSTVLHIHSQSMNISSLITESVEQEPAQKKSKANRRGVQPTAAPPDKKP